MTRKIEVKVDEIRRVFSLLEDINGLFHQPMKYQDMEYVSQFAEKKYPEIKELYYKTVWDWLPEDIQEEIEED